MDKKRIFAAGLSASAALLVALAVHEDYRGRAYLPTPQDRPTVGFGSTRRADGTPVRTGDTTTPVRALIQLHRDLTATEDALHQCLGDVPLYQREWDAYVSLAYNVGPAAVCASSLPAKLRAGDYAAACKTLLEFNQQCWRDKAGVRHCKVLPGLVKRRQAEYALCMSPAPASSTPSASTPSPATP